MKIGKRQQQGRTKATKKKIPCPRCTEYYLEPMRNTRGKKVGMYCPSEYCSYCKKDMDE